jgi:hypothetical protein
VGARTEFSEEDDHPPSDQMCEHLSHKVTVNEGFLLTDQQVNHMAGPRGPIGPWLSHKLCSIINIIPNSFYEGGNQLLTCIMSYAGTFISMLFYANAISHC